MKSKLKFSNLETFALKNTLSSRKTFFPKEYSLLNAELTFVTIFKINMYAHLFKWFVPEQIKQYFRPQADLCVTDSIHIFAFF